MLTDTLQMLHTTAAYETAVLRLMIDEANFVCKQMGLNETAPPPTQIPENTWKVYPPPEDISGYVYSENYSFSFDKGRLISVTKKDWNKKLFAARGDIRELPSHLDKNSAYELARELLASISIDVDALEKMHKPVCCQGQTPRWDASGTSCEVIALPLFEIGWGESRLDSILSECPVYMKILEVTKEMVDFGLHDTSFSKRSELLLTNAEELLGPLPPPRHFVEKLIGGPEAYRTVESPDKVEAWLLTRVFIDEMSLEYRNRSGPLQLNASETKMFSDTLLDFDRYSWRPDPKKCFIDYGARLRFTRGNDIVGVRLCYACDVVEFSHKGKAQTGDFDPGHNPLVKALQSVFPEDGIARSLKLYGIPSL
jgi:hypothetical protein